LDFQDFNKKIELEQELKEHDKQNEEPNFNDFLFFDGNEEQKNDEFALISHHHQ